MTGRPGRALLLVGSPKGGASTSEALGRYLLVGLEGRGIETEFLSVVPSLRSDGGREKILDSVGRADLVLLATPLYADSLPSGVTRLLEILAGEGGEAGVPPGRRFAVIVNCGFPEARQCDTAIAICRIFAREARLEWAGGLALGGGESIGGRPLEEAGGVARNARKALDLAAEALSEGRPIPSGAVSLMAKPAVPAWMYTAVGNFGWKSRARRHGAVKRMKDRPYDP